MTNARHALAAGPIFALGLVACGGGSPAVTETAEDVTPSRSPKRGVAYHFCGWSFSAGRQDLDALRDGISWTYNWSNQPLECADGLGVGDALSEAGVEFVPMVWGLVNGGAECATGGPCFRVDHHGGGQACDAACAGMDDGEGTGGPGHPCYECRHQPITREALAAGIPEGARYLLAFNEPNFLDQASLLPEEAARAFEHVEWVAEQRGLQIVGPATNYCDTAAEEGPAACVREPDGPPLSHVDWLERFYDACSADGVAGHDCRIDHQAVHAYACYAISWVAQQMRVKAGAVDSPEAHCTDGEQNEDESGVDCGGLACAACSERARALFARPVWLTEFANAPWGGCEHLDVEGLRERALGFVRQEVAALEADGTIFRYAWFMPKSAVHFDHVDLLVEDGDGERTPLGDAYLDAPF
jgi:hypothetical protein